jgi:PAS domain S-box-containing protein
METQTAVAPGARRTREELEAFLHTLVSVSPLGMALFDAECRFIGINEALARVAGLPPEGHVGKTPREVYPESGRAIEEVLGEVLRTGEPVTGLEMSGTYVKNPDEYRHWRLGFHPVTLPGGETVGICVTVSTA